MKKFLYFFLSWVLFVSFNSTYAQTAHKIAIQFYAEATNIGAVSIYADTINEGEIYTIQPKTLPSSYSNAQALYDALVGSEFYFELGSLNQDINLYFVISDINLSAGTYSLGNTPLFFDVDFSVQDWNGNNLSEPFNLNTGKYAVIKLFKSAAFNNFVANTGINPSLAWAFAYATATGYDLSGIQTYDSTSSITALVSHFSKVVGSNHSSVTGVNYFRNTKIPTHFALRQNYPNPFNPTTNIQYDLSQKSYVELKVYNLLGENIATLVRGVKEAGTHIVSFKPGNISSGIYIYQLKTDKITLSRKMIFMK